MKKLIGKRVRAFNQEWRESYAMEGTVLDIEGLLMYLSDCSFLDASRGPKEPDWANAKREKLGQVVLSLHTVLFLQIID